MGAKSPLGIDDKGITDEEWNAANGMRDMITLTPDDVMWVAYIYTIADTEILENEYKKLK